MHHKSFFRYFPGHVLYLSEFWDVQREEQKLNKGKTGTCVEWDDSSKSLWSRLFWLENVLARACIVTFSQSSFFERKCSQNVHELVLVTYSKCILTCCFSCIVFQPHKACCYTFFPILKYTCAAARPSYLAPSLRINSLAVLQAPIKLFGECIFFSFVWIWPKYWSAIIFSQALESHSFV